MNKAIGSKIKLDENENKIAYEYLKCVSELLESENVKNLDNYSVAVQQMIAIARACDIEAKVLIIIHSI